MKGSKTMSRRSMRITLDTQENLTDEQMGKISAMAEKTGWFTFSIEPVTPDQLINLPPLTFDKEQKTPSQRLHAVLFRLWEAKGKPTETSQQFYEQQMERIIDNIKKALP